MPRFNEIVYEDALRAIGRQLAIMAIEDGVDLDDNESNEALDQIVGDIRSYADKEFAALRKANKAKAKSKR